MGSSGHRNNVQGLLQYRSRIDTSEPATFKTVSSNSASVDGLKASTKYFIIVTATPQGGTESAPSTSVFATTAAADASNSSNGGSSDSTPSTLSTNVGTNPDVNTQDADVDLQKLAAKPKGLSKTTGSINYDKANVEALVQSACSAKFSTFSKDVKSGNTYAIINVLNLTGDNGSQSVKSNNWYIYSQDKNIWNGFIGGWKISEFNGGTRLYGAEKIYLYRFC